MAKVDLGHFRDVIKRIALDGDVGFSLDLAAVADELALARAVVEAADWVRDCLEGDGDDSDMLTAKFKLDAALAAYRAKVGGKE